MPLERGDVPVKKLSSVTVALWANRFVALLLGVLVFTLPLLLQWYCQFRELTALEQNAITIAFYCCAVVVMVALWSMDATLRTIRTGQVFVRVNVRRIRIIRWCCGIVGLICIPAACCYYPLIFMVIIMAFLFLVINVVCQVLDAAVSIREENDLTI